MNERDRDIRAIMIGIEADRLFNEICVRLGIKPAVALATSPLLTIATRRAALGVS